MKIKNKIRQIIFLGFFLCILGFIFYEILNPLFKANQVIITYGLKPFDIVSNQPKLWNFLKKSYLILFIFSNLIYGNYIYKNIENLFIKKENKKNINLYEKNKLKILIGFDEKKEKNIYVPDSGLYQNFLITGTIGSGKTSSAMYPFTRTTYGI